MDAVPMKALTCLQVFEPDQELPIEAGVLLNGWPEFPPCCLFQKKAANLYGESF